MWFNINPPAIISGFHGIPGADSALATKCYNNEPKSDADFPTQFLPTREGIGCGGACALREHSGVVAGV